jgi:crotonobetainyl-CoA:carnitine CoA-transferase CaiB-like acyl-CoA transferase
MSDTDLPLSGVRVLDLTASLAGPYCTLVLSALGADVVKIEHPGRGDDTRSWGPPFWHGESATFLALNAGKRSLAIDLKTDDGREAMLRLVDESDVVVQSLRPGAAARLGVDFDSLARRNPRLVYCSISAYGNTGPLAQQPGYDPLMQAAAGIMSVTGEPDGPPVRCGISVVDQGTALWSAIGVMAALRAREKTGEPQLVETSLFEAAVNWLPYQIVGYLGSGRLPRRLGTGLGILAPYEAFATRDGSLMIAVANDGQFASLCQTLGMPEQAHDPRFQANPDRVENREALRSLIAERVVLDDTEVWLERLAQANVPAAPVQDIAQVLEHPQTEALGLLQPVPHPIVPSLQLVALPLSVGGQRLVHRTSPPLLGEHSDAILEASGYSALEVRALRSAGTLGADRGIAPATSARTSKPGERDMTRKVPQDQRRGL